MTTLTRRTEYTQAHNRLTGRHGWLRLTPAYSLKLVEEFITAYDRPMRILDPFCGTATTALSAAYHGHQAITTDINPFLVWFGGVKTAHYADSVLNVTHQAAREVLNLVQTNALPPAQVPGLHNIERWWSRPALQFLCLLKTAIEQGSDDNSHERNLLYVAFCRTLIALSNASFNHQSMSFRADDQLVLPFETSYGEQFTADVGFVLNGAAHNPFERAQVMLADARMLSSVLQQPVQRVITSPPYANRMSYIRELRPYMYWLDFLETGRDAGELDWSAIGGTWGIATSRLADWQASTDSFEHPVVRAASNAIAAHDRKSGSLLANYILRYVDDMWMHFRSLCAVLEAGAEVHYIVGNSAFYGVLFPVEVVYADMLNELGFQHVACRPVRKRNSKKELIEYDVTAVWKS